MTCTPIGITRKRLEAKIEELVELLDLVDGDCDLEDDDREPEETDMNGDEGDCCFSEDEGWGRLGYDGSGVIEAEDLIGKFPAASRRARSHADAPPIPLVYDFRGMQR